MIEVEYFPFLCPPSPVSFAVFTEICPTAIICTYLRLSFRSKFDCRLTDQGPAVMAEVFGLAASVVGIAGVAGQLGDGVRKLNKFRRDVWDAPKEIHALTEALNALLGALSHAHEKLAAVPAAFDSPAVQKALEVCERVARNTSEMVDRANQGLLADRRTTLARLKIALK